mgnify:CR=1 FL=1
MEQKAISHKFELEEKPIPKEGKGKAIPKKWKNRKRKKKTYKKSEN